MRRPRIRAVALGSALATTLGAGLAESTPVRSYTDTDGVVHLTNVRGGRKAAHIRPAAPHGSLVPMALLDAVVAESAELYNLPTALVKAVIATESNYNPWAVSEKGAVGLMQLMPQTAREMYVEDPFDPVQNIQGGTRYLRVLVNQFDGDLVKVIAAYNAGPEVVRRTQTKGEFVVPPIPETQDYVRKVLQSYEALKAAASALKAHSESAERS